MPDLAQLFAEAEAAVPADWRGPILAPVGEGKTRVWQVRAHLGVHSGVNVEVRASTKEIALKRFAVAMNTKKRQIAAERLVRRRKEEQSWIAAFRDHGHKPGIFTAEGERRVLRCKAPSCRAYVARQGFGSFEQDSRGTSAPCPFTRV
jgi:hypothetical protein